MINVTVFAAKSGVAKGSGKPYFRQLVEHQRPGRPTASWTRFSSDEKYVLPAGQYTAEVSLLEKTMQVEGKASTVLTATVYDYKPVAAGK